MEAVDWIDLTGQLRRHFQAQVEDCGDLYEIEAAIGYLFKPGQLQDLSASTLVKLIEQIREWASLSFESKKRRGLR